MSKTRDWYTSKGRLEKFRECREKYKTKYREQTGSGKYPSRAWTDEEMDLILKHEIPDKVLAKEIRRSVTAIQVERAKLKSKLKQIKSFMESRDDN
jgi:hypothetical protein